MTDYRLHRRSVTLWYPFYPYGFHPFMYGWGWGWSMPYAYTELPTYSYTEGTLIIDVTDAKTDELVWRGAVTGKVDDVSNLQKQIVKVSGRL